MAVLFGFATKREDHRDDENAIVILGLCDVTGR